MRALLLAGGFGTRLRPLTNTRPKHLLPIANRPHIQHVFDLLVAHGVDGVVLLTSYLADKFEDATQDARARGIDVEVAHEVEPLGTGGALKNGEDFVGDGTFLAFNGDVLTNFDLGRILEFHREREAEATIVLTPVEDPSAFGVVPTDDDGRVRGFIEKPPPGEAPTNLINAGIYVLEPSVLGRIPAGEVWSAERALFPGLVEEGARLFAVEDPGYWIDIGTPQKYLEANLDALAGRFPTDAVPSSDPDAALVAPGARIDPGARIVRSCVGEGAVVDAGAMVEDSVLLPRARVEAGATIRRSILGEGASAASGSSIEDSAVADAERIGV